MCAAKCIITLNNNMNVRVVQVIIKMTFTVLNGRMTAGVIKTPDYGYTCRPAGMLLR